MSTLPVTDALGYAQQAKQLVTNYKTDMTAKGFDPTARMAQLDTLAASLSAEDEKQEAMKTSLRQQTDLVISIKDKLVKEASAACDTILAAYGRGTDQAKEATRLRNSVSTVTHRAAKTKTTP